MNSGPIRPTVRILNTAFAVALAAFVLANYWPIVKLFDLARADLQYQGEWVGGHAKRITAVTPGGVADRAGLKPGDVLEFDPGRDSGWVLAGYRNMPEGFSGGLQVRRSDGTRTVVTARTGASGVSADAHRSRGAGRAFVQSDAAGSDLCNYGLGASERHDLGALHRGLGGNAVPRLAALLLRVQSRDRL